MTATPIIEARELHRDPLISNQTLDRATHRRRRARRVLERAIRAARLVARDGDTGLARALAKDFDLIVLDLMLPGEDGLAICRRLRGQPSAPAIVMLTAKGDDVDRIVGLEMGADDYLAKPFNPRELLARIKAVLRRTNSLPRRREALDAEQIRFDRWTLKVAQRELIDADGDVAAAVDTYLLREETIAVDPISRAIAWRGSVRVQK